MLRVYLMPLQVTAQNQRGPAYIKWRFNPGGIDCQWELSDYGAQAVCLVVADLDQAQHEALVANLDVLAVPENLDANVSSLAVPIIQSAFEALNIPGDWVNTTQTYRQIVKMCNAVFAIARQVLALGFEPIFQGRTLSTRINQLPVALRNGLVQACQDLGADTTSIVGSTTLRQALNIVGQQVANLPANIGSIVL
jgi:hypothetical protein